MSLLTFLFRWKKIQPFHPILFGIICCLDRGAEKAESRLATSMSTRGKRKLMGDTQWIRCQNCGKWRALLRSMDPSTYVGPGLVSF